MTDEQLAAYDHISDAEIRDDISVTQREIRTLQWRIQEAQEGINQREAFVAKITEIMNARNRARIAMLNKVRP